MDGYAVRASDTPGALRVIGEAGAGNALQVPLAPGECARIFTGAPLPVGADAILIQEDAVRDQDIVTAPQIAPAPPRARCRHRFPRGRSRPDVGRDAQCGFDRACGHPGDEMHLPSQGAHGSRSLGGGDELVTPGDTPLADQVFDSMSFAVAALVEQWGGGASTAPPLKDRGADVARAIAETLTPNDLTVIIGGASVGDHDHARPAVRELGGEILFEKVSLRPGKPTWFARIEKKPCSRSSR
jgi:molybdopterin molybdotransferase